MRTDDGQPPAARQAGPSGGASPQVGASGPTLFDRLPIGAYRCAADGTPLRVNDALGRMHGYDDGAQMMQALTAVDAQGWYVDTERRAQFRQQLQLEGQLSGFVSQIRRQRDGSTLWISESAHLLPGGDGAYEGTVEDVTERMQALHALERSDELLRQMTWHFPGVVFRTRWPARGEPTLDYVSDGVRELYGIEPEEAMADANALARMRHPDDDAAVQAGLLESRRHGTPHTAQFRIVRRDGSIRWVQGTVSFVARVGDDDVRTGVILDITAQREAAALRAQRDSAEAERRASAAMLSRVSHELRTPLNAVLGFGQLLERDPALPERQREWAAQVVASGRHLLALVEDVLGLSSVASRELPLQCETVPLAPLLAECASMLASQAADRQVTLDAPPVDAPAVHADRRRLRQALANLLSNAVKYNRVGGRVAVAVTAEGALVHIAVRDTGQGLDAAQLSRLFQPVDCFGSERGPVARTGLGLALTRDLVQAMGGRVDVESTPGEGSTFVISLPAAAAG